MYVQAVTYPSMAAMLSKWAPPLERSKMTTFIYAGNKRDVARFHRHLLTRLVVVNVAEFYALLLAT